MEQAKKTSCAAVQGGALQTRSGLTPRQKLWLLLLVAFAVRLLLAVATKGYVYDRTCFVAWGDKMAAEGAAAFYSEGYFADYPPGYILVLGIVGTVRKLLKLETESRLLSVLLVLVPALCDCGAVALIWRAGQRMRDEKARWRVAVFATFCPVLLFDTGVWKQIDGAFTLPILLCFWLLEQRRTLPAALCYGIALAIKPQALLVGPVLAICFLAQVWQAPKSHRVAAVLQIPAGAALALMPVLLAGLPFFGLADLIPGLVAKYTETSSSYPYATINAFNWFEALGGNWVDQTLPVFSLLKGITWQGLGVFHLLAMTVALAALAWYSLRRDKFSPVLLAAFYAVGVYTLSHRMHERYLVFGVVLTLMAAALWDNRYLLGAAAGLSVTSFLNLACVYSMVDSEDEWLQGAVSSSFARTVGFAQTLCFALFCAGIFQLLRDEKATASDKAEKIKTARQTVGGRSAAPAPQLPWTKREMGIVAALTVVTALFSFANLGELTAPQNPMDATYRSESTTFSLAGDTVPASIWVYPGISTGGSLTIRDAATGEVLYTKELSYITTFCWTQETFAPGSGQYTAQLENASVFELSLRDAGGKPVPVTGGDALFDEQEKVPAKISQLNSMYFDEIYHGRTGYEMLHGLVVYETTHPPLGKDFIMLGIAIFGMTGFGWRFSGTLFGVLLVPVMYWVVRRLTRKRWVAGTAAALLAMDWMRFAQSRIATIDIYATFFILLAAGCMIWYCQSVLEKGVGGSWLPMALGGLAFGLGCASKWTGIYAGAGLAVLYLGVLWLRYRQGQTGFWHEFRLAAVGGVVCYVLLPVLIYWMGYLPYLWHDAGFSLADWWKCQTYMYDYHANLVATHPFESRWYTWALDLRPVWYYGNSNLPAGQSASIAGMGGPIMWWCGLAAILTLAWRTLTGRASNRSNAVLVLYAAQLAPWMLVTRCTFLYHYFPSSMFGMVALALLLGEARDEKAARKTAKVLLGASAVLLMLFYPAISGLTVPTWYANLLEVLPSWSFYM